MPKKIKLHGAVDLLFLLVEHFRQPDLAADNDFFILLIDVENRKE